MAENVHDRLLKRLKDKNIEIEDFKDILKDVKKIKYGLNWEEHTEDIEGRIKNSKLTLKEEEDLCINYGYDYTDNILIEGDNLTSLLTMRDEGKKVDVIYIDPPYNTGNKFAYNDKIVDSEDSFRHSKWLSFMEKRLKIARDLMFDDGVIFISIDDNEQANLKLLMDEVFGEKNFVANVVVENNPKGRRNSKYFSYSHEYLLVYGKNKTILPEFKDTIIPYNNGKQLEDDIGAYKHGRRVLVGKSTNPEVIDLNSDKNYDVLYNFESNTITKLNRDVNGNYINFSISLLQKNEKIYKNINSRTGNINYATLTWDKFNDLFQSNDLIFKDNTVYQKIRNIETRIKSLLSKQSTGGVDLLNESSGRLLREMLNNDTFIFPKNINLIKEIIKLIDNKSVTILDFFAGSGTTGHAVLELNKEDGGSRSFILCNNNENNICKNITYERIKSVIKGYTTSKGVRIEGIKANLKYLKTDVDETGLEWE